MTGTLTIAARELRERSFVFVTAAVMSLVPFIPSLFPVSRTADRLLVIIFTGTVGALAFAIALSIVMGGSMVARELADKRLSFYFSKPVSASAIWFGKVVGAIVTIALCCAIVWTPALLVGHSEWRTGVGLSTGFLILVIAVSAISILLISHAVNTAVRSRSPIVVLDLALFTVSAVVLWQLVRPFFVSNTTVLFQRVLVGVIVMVPIAILAGGAWQLSRGRTDIRRSHRELSLFFWSAMAIVLLIAGSYVGWVFSAGPADIRINGVVSTADANWVGISGTAKYRGDYRPTFVIDAKTRRSIRMFGSSWMSNAEFTHSGDAVLSLDATASSFDRRGEVHLIRLNGAGSDDATGIVVSSSRSTVVVSDDLCRLATYDASLLSVHDLASKTQLASVRIPFGVAAQMFFVNDDLVRLYANNTRGSNGHAVQQEMRIYEFNAKTRELVQTGSMTAMAAWMIVRANTDGSTLVVNQYGGPDGPKLRLLDGRTGAERAVVDGRVSFQVAPLRDGGVAFIARKGDSCSARILDAKGSIVADIPLGTRGWGGMIEVVPGRKYIATVLRPVSARSQGTNDWDLYVVDAQRGVVDRVEHGFALTSMFSNGDMRSLEPAAGEYIVVDAQNAIWRWNALTGARVRVL